MHRLSILFCTAIFFTFPALLQAHPHMMLTSRCIVHGDRGMPTGLTLEWDFDKFFSADIRNYYDTDKDGVYNDEETREVYQYAFSNLEKYNYFVFLREGDNRYSPEEVENFRVQNLDDETVRYCFDVSLDRFNGKELNIAVYDSSFFCHVSYDEKNPVILDFPETSKTPRVSLAENREYPVYYDPFAPASDLSLYPEWRPGLKTFYPTEIQIALPDKTGLLLLFCIPLLFSVMPLKANPFLGAPEKPVPQVSVAGQTNPDLTEKQLTLRNRMADLFLTIKKGDAPGVLLLLYGISFLYGMLHAAGPGHRKTIVFSLYLSREAKSLEPLAMGVLLALLHGGSAVLLILIYKSTAGPLLSRNLNASTLQMEGWAYSLLALLSLLLLTGSVRHAVKGHAHERTTHKRTFWAIGLTGFFPCPGAIMILIFTLTQDMLITGILAVTAMSLGMAFPISLAGYLAYYGKKGIFRIFKNREKLIRTWDPVWKSWVFSSCFPCPVIWPTRFWQDG